MSAKQKYKLAFHTIVDPTTFVVLAGVAGAEQYNGTYLGYGPGIEGYGKRYGAALADSASGRIIGSAVLPSLFHQDPRYFYQGSGGIRSRTWHALTSALVTRGDSGKLQPNYSGGRHSKRISSRIQPRIGTHPMAPSFAGRIL